MLSTGGEVKKTVADDQLEIEVKRFRTQTGEYAEEWIPIDDGTLILRSSIVAVTVQKGEGGPFVAWA
jgi:hypothetical protein